MDKKSVRAVIDGARKVGRRALSGPEAKKLCDAYGIPVPKEGLAKTADEAAKIANRLRFPVVMKIVSDDILHKTEAGGVVVGLESAADVKRAFAQIVKNAKSYKKNAGIQGVQVQQMLAGGHEVIVGAVTDPSFGKMIAFGLGGVLVEAMKGRAVDAGFDRRGGNSPRASRRKGRQPRCSGRDYSEGLETGD